MAQHAAFRIPGRATRVDQATALTGLLPVHLGHDGLIFHGLPNLQEVLPQEEAGAGVPLWNRALAPDDERLDSIVLVEVHSEALEVLSRLDHDHLGL